MSKKKHYDLTFINIMCFVALILSVSFVFGFTHGRVLWKWDGYILDTNVVGQYGDFIGGFVGTFLTVILLYYTFHQQRKDSSENSKVYKKQQLNDDFYHLMSLYQEILSSLIFSAGDDEGEALRGKEALHAHLDDMREGFASDIRAERLRKSAVWAYMDFYARNRDFAPIYYRTLYRLCEILVDKEEGTEYKNVELVKILRAQLSDSEMVMMKYNAQTRMGKPFQQYINRFNLLKHLPPLDLLEYKNFRKHIKEEENISALNIILVQIRQRMEDILDNDSTTHVTLNEFKSTASIALMVSPKRDEMKLVITKQKVTILQPHDFLNCIMKLDTDITEELFSYFIYDCVVLHNFQVFNIRKNLDFTNEMMDKGDKLQFTFMVKNKVHHSINMTWNQYSTRYRSSKETFDL